MKNKKFIPLALLMFVGSANAASFSYTPYVFDGETTYRTLLATCGSSSNVGASSLFGASKNYPIMSRFHAEIESMPRITPESRSYALQRFKTAMNYKNNVFGYVYDISSMINRNGAYISATDTLYKDTMSKYQESVDQLQTESDSITEMAIDDVLDRMSDNYPGSTEFGLSDYGVWSKCMGWWVAGMPYYMTDAERAENQRRMNGWKDGELTNEPYQYPSTSIAGLDLSKQSYTYDRKSYNKYVTTDDAYQKESSTEQNGNSSTSGTTKNSESGSNDGWWNNSKDTNKNKSDSSAKNWWE